MTATNAVFSSYEIRLHSRTEMGHSYTQKEYTKAILRLVTSPTIP